ncbi:MAG: bifunctional demethylmenaquinone methyltransferase/2-methoxy-6-polyprenyl-1,4-benzoquinol methylase UbiE [Verrucomicrobiota bacterium]
MPANYFQPGPDRAALVEDLFAVVALRYDRLNDLQSLGLHRLWKRRLVRLAQAGPADRALDVCCGTGEITLALADAGAEVTGLDFSEPMLAVARHRAGCPRPARRVRFLQGDALHLPFPDHSFEVVTISYGLRNLADFERGLDELQRVLVPGGRLLVLDFGHPDSPVWRSLYFAYLGWAVPLFGRVFAGNAPAYAYILDSLRAYPAQRGVEAGLARRGFSDRRILPLLGGMMSINTARAPRPGGAPAGPGWPP